MSRAKKCLCTLICVGAISDAVAGETVMFHKWCGDASTSAEISMCSSANRAAVGNMAYGACNNQSSTYVSPYSEYSFCGGV